MATDYENKVYPGGIRNRINRVTMKTGGRSTASYNDAHTDQANYAPRSVIRRITNEPPTDPDQQDTVKDFNI